MLWIFVAGGAGIEGTLGTRRSSVPLYPLIPGLDETKACAGGVYELGGCLGQKQPGNSSPIESQASATCSNSPM